MDGWMERGRFIFPDLTPLFFVSRWWAEKKDKSKAVRCSVATDSNIPASAAALCLTNIIWHINISTFFFLWLFPPLSPGASLWEREHIWLNEKEHSNDCKTQASRPVQWGPTGAQNLKVWPFAFLHLMQCQCSPVREVKWRSQNRVGLVESEWEIISHTVIYNLYRGTDFMYKNHEYNWQ